MPVDYEIETEVGIAAWEIWVRVFNKDPHDDIDDCVRHYLSDWIDDEKTVAAILEYLAGSRQYLEILRRLLFWGCRVVLRKEPHIAADLAPYVDGAMSYVTNISISRNERFLSADLKGAMDEALRRGQTDRDSARKWGLAFGYGLTTPEEREHVAAMSLAELQDRISIFGS